MYSVEVASETPSAKQSVLHLTYVISNNYREGFIQHIAAARKREKQVKQHELETRPTETLD